MKNEKIADEKKVSNFIRNRIDEDLKLGKNNNRVHTRFPPEPNGYLHIGHAKSILLNYGIANDYNGLFNLRFDDTNPTAEDIEYVNSIQEDVKWLGANWEDRMFFSSDYFEKLYDYAIELIKKEKAYVCDLTLEEMREMRGTLTEPGKNSPYRNRSIEENLGLFEQMRDGKFEDGAKVLRAKIDMASPNLNMRDPVIYRIKKAHHHRTGDNWCIYPMYDFTHCLSDAIEGITHSICTLEFEDHRPLYDWYLDVLDVEHHPQQIEFARLNLSYTLMSKRKLLKLVQEKVVDGWDDPRMPTIAGIRRRGYSPEAMQDFAERIGVAKADSVVDIALLEHCVREDLNKTATRVMVVMDPVKLVVTNYPEDQVEMLDADNNPEDVNAGKRQIPFSRELYVERDDYMEDAPRKWFRMTIGKEVRLKHAYYVMITDVVKDENGKITEIHCTYDPETRGGWVKGGRKVKGTLHWVSAKQAKDVEVRLYDHLFTKEIPGEVEEGQTFLDNVNQNSLTVKTAKAEPTLLEAEIGARFQFLRTGYYCVDSKYSKPNKPVLNRTVALKDSWAKIAKKLK